jgi:hypothetical protein
METPSKSNVLEESSDSSTVGPSANPLLRAIIAGGDGVLQAQHAMGPDHYKTPTIVSAAHTIMEPMAVAAAPIVTGWSARSRLTTIGSSLKTFRRLSKTNTPTTKPGGRIHKISIRLRLGSGNYAYALPNWMGSLGVRSAKGQCVFPPIVSRPNVLT